MAIVETTGAPVAQQYERFREAVSATHLPWDLPSNGRRRFAAAIRARPLGAAQTIACACDPCRGRRGPAELARSSAEMFGVLCILDGRERIAHRRGEVELGARTFALWDSTGPLGFDVPGALRKVTLLVPAAVLAAAIPAPHRHVGRAIDGSTGCGALFLRQLEALDQLPAALPASQQDAALRSTLDLLGAALGDATDGAATLAAAAAHHARARLDDPDLDPDAIAAALGVTRRRLDRAFATTGITVTRWIWRERVERVRRDLLLEPRASLLELAFRRGFRDASHFTRAFRRELGESPRAYRARMLGRR